MKKILLIVTIVFISLEMKAQFPGGGQQSGMRQPPPSIGHIYGKVIDDNGKAISDVSVVLLESRIDTTSRKTKDILLKVTATKNNGRFSFEELLIPGSLK